MPRVEITETKRALLERNISPRTVAEYARVLRAVQEFARHARPETTSGYTRATKHRLLEVMRSLEYSGVRAIRRRWRRRRATAGLSRGRRNDDGSSRSITRGRKSPGMVPLALRKRVPTALGGWTSREPELPLLARLPINRQPPGEAAIRCELQRSRVDRKSHVEGSPSLEAGRAPRLELSLDSYCVLPDRSLHMRRLAVRIK